MMSNLPVINGMSFAYPESRQFSGITKTAQAIAFDIDQVEVRYSNTGAAVLYVLDVRVDGTVYPCSWHTSEASAIAAMLAWQVPAQYSMLAMIEAERELTAMMATADMHMSAQTASRLNSVLRSIRRAIGG